MNFKKNIFTTKTGLILSKNANELFNETWNDFLTKILIVLQKNLRMKDLAKVKKFVNKKNMNEFEFEVNVLMNF